MQVKSNRIIVYRKWYNDTSTCGEMTHDNKFLMFSLEDKVRAQGVKIYGETAIDAGVYGLDLTVSNRFKRLLPILSGVKNFAGVRIHRGNKHEDTHGCLLVGLGIVDDKNFILESAIAEKMLIDYIQTHEIDEIQIIDTRAVS